MTVTENLARVRADIDDACRAAGRDPAGVRLVPVSKYHPPAAIREAAALGYRLFGESRPQELATKHVELGDSIGFAQIGQLQTNKAGLIANHAAELQSLDSLRLAAVLQRRLEPLGRRLPVLIQVNTSGEQAKSGITPGEVVSFAQGLRAFDALEPRGLMTMAVNSPVEDEVAACFQRLVRAQERLRDEFGGGWDELSMGMSGDYRIAIAQGSTCVRIGTAIFGPRPSAD